ncbi:penicillin-binding protein 1A [Orrella daihaiensis]|uniref:Penicillin-binding protein 1A n=1 Tax=Orrella daihaiensis TaxID=2782176 RepID=A0ABY4AJJ9_9BURK|nr:PBP1A family penicillin-binding protein [Orrella daihaiensis]UOD50466.1 PBP1A family penicillin-binding protein [Orrella daihaiensis]
MSKSTPKDRSAGIAAASSSSPWIVRFFMKLFVLGLAGAASVALLLVIALSIAWPNLPDLTAMTDYRPRVPLRVFTADKVLIGEFGEERRNVLRFNEFPDVLKSAVLAAEDDGFYQHGGIDWAGVVRAGLANVAAMSKTQGASTITMQVARNFYLSSEKTYTRKFYELLLTYKIESSLTKDQILELYLNQIYLGRRAYGFAAAARTYFGKEVSELTAAEAAMLAGIPKAPSRFNPVTNMVRAQARQRYVLGRMHELGYLTNAEYQAALAEPIVLNAGKGTPAGGYAVHGEYAAELARQLMFSLYGEEVYSRGLNIYTTIQSTDQEWAWRSLRDGVLQYTRRARYPGPVAQLDLPAGLEKQPEQFDAWMDGVLEEYPDAAGFRTAVVLSANPKSVTLARASDEIITIDDKKILAVISRSLNPKADDQMRMRRGSIVTMTRLENGQWEILNFPEVEGAMVAMTPQDGAIRAMVGGFDFFSGKFNRVTQAWRQPGSSFKPFIYAASLERGMTPTTLISDQPFMLTAEQTGSGEDWNPKNYGNEYDEELTMRQAMAKSRNMVSIRILQAITPQYVQDYITRFGFQPEKHPPFLPMALGAGSVTPLQMAAAFSVFANGGYRVTPFLIDYVTDSENNVLMRAKPTIAGDAAARVLDPRTVYVMNDMLRGVAQFGTAARAGREIGRRDLAGKTGTTNDSVDAWFAGYTPRLVGVAWLGFDQPKSLGSRETGGGAALPIWMGYMKKALEKFPEEPPGPPPSGLIVNGEAMFFAEYPPNESISRVGLDQPKESIDELLESLNMSGNSSAVTPAPITN